MKYAAAYLLVRNACATYCPADPNARGWKAKARCALTSRRSVASSRAGAGSPDAASWRCGRSSGFRVARWMSSEPTRRARPPREHPSSCFLVLGFSANPFPRPSLSPTTGAARRQGLPLGGRRQGCPRFRCVCSRGSTLRRPSSVARVAPEPRRKRRFRRRRPPSVRGTTVKPQPGGLDPSGTLARPPHLPSGIARPSSHRTPELTSLTAPPLSPHLSLSTRSLRGGRRRQAQVFLRRH